MMLEIYTDGAYSSAREAGGIGIVFVKDGKKCLEYNKRFKNTTNNKCELLAVIYSLSLIKQLYNSIIIYSDSQYVIGCATKGWQRKKNVSLWNKYDSEFKRVSELGNKIEFVWVKGHKDNLFNNIADELAVQASQWID